jgi:hypothetical protein
MIMDWQAWKTALELWAKTPELIVASIFVLLAGLGGGWKARSHTAAQREANLKDTAAFLDGRLRECREDLRGVKGELQDAVHQAKADQQRITKEVEELRRENSDLRSAIEAALTGQPNHWGDGHELSLCEV